MANRIAFRLAHLGALFIGFDCIAFALTSFNSLAFAALPAIAGFILNYGLYLRDHAIIDEVINNPWQLLKMDYAVSALSGLIMSLFAYQCWSLLFQDYAILTLYLPNYFVWVCAFAIGIGTFVLLGHDLTQQSKDVNWDMIQEQWLFASIAFINIFLLISNNVWPKCITLLTGLLPSGPWLMLGQLMLFLMSLSLIYTEVIFNFSVFNEYFKVAASQLKPDGWNISLLTVLLNAIANGYITYGEYRGSFLLGSMIVVISALTSWAVMCKNHNKDGIVNIQALWQSIIDEAHKGESQKSGMHLPSLMLMDFLVIASAVACHCLHLPAWLPILVLVATVFYDQPPSLPRSEGSANTDSTSLISGAQSANNSNPNQSQIPQPDGANPTKRQP